MAQRVKPLPAKQKTCVRSLGQEDPLEKEMATHSSILAWRIAWTEEPGRLQFTGCWSDMTERLHFHFLFFRGTRDQIANIRWIKEKAREFLKNIYFCFIDYTKAFDWVDHNKLWKILKEMGIPDHLTCLLRNLYAGQEATVRTRHGKTD